MERRADGDLVVGERGQDVDRVGGRGAGAEEGVVVEHHARAVGLRRVGERVRPGGVRPDRERQIEDLVRLIRRHGGLGREDAAIIEREDGEDALGGDAHGGEVAGGHGVGRDADGKVVPDRVLSPRSRSERQTDHASMDVHRLSPKAFPRRCDKSTSITMGRRINLSQEPSLPPATGGHKAREHQEPRSPGRGNDGDVDVGEFEANFSARIIDRSDEEGVGGGA